MRAQTDSAQVNPGSAGPREVSGATGPDPALGIPVVGMPAFGMPALGMPALGIPALGRPVLGKPVTGSGPDPATGPVGRA
ncbi:hypothetical protein ACWKSP_06340 [Micromonosporaceae bacterium Da 78-11]